MRFAVVALVACFASLAYAQDSDTQVLAVAVDLGTMTPGGYTLGNAINNKGHVVGEGTSPRGLRIPFLWTPERGFRKVLGETPGVAWDINERDQVIGVFLEPYRGFLWERSRVVELGNFLPSKINDLGQIAGDCNSQPCVWHQGVVYPLSVGMNGTGQGAATAINNSGVIVGRLEQLDGSWVSVLWESLNHEPSTLAGVGQPWAINDRDEVVAGSCCVEPAVVWQDGALRMPPSSDAIELSAINKQGSTVGYNLARRRGIVWTSEGEVIELAAVGTLSVAKGVNDRGAVVGNALTKQGISHAAIWRFAQPPSRLHIETPNTPSLWGLNTRQRLSWRYDGDAPQVLIEISRNGGRTWDYLTTVANTPGMSQNFFWRVTGPLAFASRFRVSAIGDPGAADVNDADIRIARAAIEMLKPNEETSIASGTPLTIFYRHSLGAGAAVAIDVSSNNGTSWRTVAETETTGSTTASFRWVVDLPPVTRARVRIRALDRSGARDVSPAFVVTAAAAGD